jgi:hypothetical protein
MVSISKPALLVCAMLLLSSNVFAAEDPGDFGNVFPLHANLEAIETFQVRKAACTTRVLERYRSQLVVIHARI